MLTGIAGETATITPTRSSSSTVTTVGTPIGIATMIVTGIVTAITIVTQPAMTATDGMTVTIEGGTATKRSGV